MKLRTLSLDRLNLRDERFRTSYFFCLDQLILSIRKVGMLSPPLVAVRNKKYTLVTGWKRVLACSKLSLSPIKALVEDDVDDLRLFLLSLYDNMATRETSLLEKAEIVRRLEKFGVKRETIIRRYLPLLKVPAARYYLDLLISVCQAAAPVKKFIYEKNMPLSVLQTFLEFPPEDQQLLFSLLLPLGQNKQKELLDDLREIQLRDNLKLEDILSSPEILEVLNSQKLSEPQKAERVRGLVRAKRYPHFSAWKESLDSTLRKVHWPKSVQLEPSPSFEEEASSVTFFFKNSEEFRAALRKLEEISSHRDFSKMFKPST